MGKCREGAWGKLNFIARAWSKFMEIEVGASPDGSAADTRIKRWSPRRVLILFLCSGGSLRINEDDGSAAF